MLTIRFAPSANHTPKNFYQHLNAICSHIQFTIKEKQNSSISFLDNLVTEEQNGITSITLSTGVYKKSTHNRYLHYMSHFPKHQKFTVAKTLIYRTNTLVSNKNHLHSELLNIRSTLFLTDFQWAQLISLFTEIKVMQHSLLIILLYASFQAYQKRLDEF